MGKSQMGMDLQSYLTIAVENIIKDSIRATFDDPKESAFLLKFAAAARRAAKRREKLKQAGEHLPPFLIASLTRGCNLHCAGCFAHAVTDARDGTVACGSTAGSAPRAEAKEPMNADDWDRVFKEAEDLGVSFVFLVGGEPLLCRDVIERAGAHGSILFPVITNGMLLNDAYIRLFDAHRNLLPVISIEGGEASTDDRRGEGIYQVLRRTMAQLKQQGLPFGVSITVTTENLEEVTGVTFLQELQESGCRMVLYVEYVPTGPEDLHLAPAEAHRLQMEQAILRAREVHDRMVILAFPGDEKAYGGCLAAGRGFFHINAEGDAEPCPFAPYSDINVRETSLREAIRSRLFARLEKHDMLQEDHDGGCALAGKGEEIMSLLSAAEEE